ncbi:MAG: HAD family hydrolase [Lactobacillales bacterium]|jgi:Cof subfamily protein (haloacid dehalogenase superfamily)|nr:HAD family hydrolase [Lactobacillales bacterium]
MEKKLFVFDIDGTLLRDDKSFSQDTYDALQELKEAGHEVTIASGRSYLLAQHVIEGLDFNNYILCNGSAGFINHEQFHKELIDEVELRRFMGLCQLLDVKFALQSLDDVGIIEDFSIPSVDAFMKHLGSKGFMLDERFKEENDIYQALLFAPESIFRFFGEGNLFKKIRFARFFDMGVDVIPADVSKASAIFMMADEMGIERHNIYAFGDGENDREMLSLVHNSVAMGNAEGDLKEVATHVTETNEEDGIVRFLERQGFIPERVRA